MLLDRFQVGVKLGSKFINEWLQAIYLFRRQKVSPKGATKPVTGFVKGTTRHGDKSGVIQECTPSGSFRNVGSNSIRGSYNLLSDCVLGKEFQLVTNSQMESANVSAN